MNAALRPGGWAFEEVVDAVRRRGRVRLEDLENPKSGLLDPVCRREIRVNFAPAGRGAGTGLAAFLIRWGPSEDGGRGMRFKLVATDGGRTIKVELTGQAAGRGRGSGQATESSRGRWSSRGRRGVRGSGDREITEQGTGQEEFPTLASAYGGGQQLRNPAPPRPPQPPSVWQQQGPPAAAGAAAQRRAPGSPRASGDGAATADPSPGEGAAACGPLCPAADLEQFPPLTADLEQFPPLTADLEQFPPLTDAAPALVPGGSPRHTTWTWAEWLANAEKHGPWALAGTNGDPPPLSMPEHRHRLPKYPMPPELIDFTFAELHEWLRNRVGAAPEGPVELTACNYVALQHGLLCLEERQMMIDVLAYDVEHAELAEREGRPDLLDLRLPGLAEKRPSVLRGDPILLQSHADSNEVHRGFVHYVNLDSVSVHFTCGAVRRRGPGLFEPYRVRFSVNRQQLRRQHHALELCAGWPILRLIAPPSARSSHGGELQYNLIHDAAVAGEVVSDRLRCCPELFVHCEGEGLSRRGALHLLQMGDDYENFVFDLQALGRDGVRCSGLLQLLESDSTAKLMWDCREAADALCHQFGVRLEGVADLQLLEVLTRGAEPCGAPREPQQLRGIEALAGPKDEVDGAEFSLLISQRPLPAAALDAAARRLDRLRSAAQKLGLCVLGSATRDKLQEASKRYCTVLRGLPTRNYDHYEKGKAPWAGPYLPDGIVDPPTGAVCQKCQRCVAPAPLAPCRVCAAIDAARPLPAEHSAGRRWRQPSLNRNQRAAVDAIGSMGPAELRIIFGPPGTGKTVTVVSAIQRVLEAGHTRVLCACPSNTAADVVAERLSTLLTPLELYRCYAASRDQSDCPAALVPYSTPNPGGGYSMHDLRTLARFRVIIATCSMSFCMYSLGLPQTHFSHVFVDEAGQATEPDCLLPVCASPDAALVLAGDPRQLGPVVRSPLAIRYGLGRSMLDRLIADARHAAAVTQLTETYRAHEAITALYSDTFYEGSLVPRAPRPVADRFVGWPCLPNPHVPMLFWHVEGRETRDEGSPSWYNKAEIDAVRSVMDWLIRDGKLAGEEEVGVITPYLKQERMLRAYFERKGKFRGVCVRTVEGFQGQERPVIIVTTVRSRPEHLCNDRKFQLGFVEHPQRTNVAISRPQSLLVVVGNLTLLAVDPNWNRIIQQAQQLRCTKGLNEDIALETGRMGVVTAAAVLHTADSRDVKKSRGRSVKVHPGAAVKIIGSKTGHLRVRTMNGAVGYVPADHISFSAAPEVSSINVDTPWRGDW